MKRVVIFIVTSFLLGSIAISAQPQQQPAADQTDPAVMIQNQDPLTKEQIQLAKRILDQAMNDQQKTGSGSSQPKTMADVLDKGIDVFAGYVTSVSGMVKSLAPEVWRVMIRQQYAKAITGPIIPAFIFFLAVLYRRMDKKWLRLKPTDKEIDFSDDSKTGRTWALTILPVLVMGAMGIWFAIEMTHSIQIAINPEYYALKDLLGLITGKTV